jgi:hypothetical protein
VEAKAWGGKPNRFPLGMSHPYHIEDADVRHRSAGWRDRFFCPLRGIVSTPSRVYRLEKL